jgi:hypothetical protein
MNNENQSLLTTHFWKLVQEYFHIHQLYEKKPKNFNKLYELDPDEVNIDIDFLNKW